MRLFFFLLVFGNLLFFAWAQGYFGTSDEGRETQRLGQQLQAEKLRIVTGAAAIEKEEPGCRLINGLSMAEAGALKAAVEAAAGQAKILPLAEPVVYVAVIGDLVGTAAAEKKVAELTRLGIEGHKAVALEGGRHEVVLAGFATEAAARDYLQGLTKRGIRSARLEPRQQRALKAQAEVRASTQMLLQHLPKLIAAYAGATAGECAR